EGQMMRGRLENLLPMGQEPQLDSESQKLGTTFDQVLHPADQMRADNAQGTLKLGSKPVSVSEGDLDKFQVRHIKMGQPEHIVVSTFPNGVGISRGYDPNLMPPPGGKTTEMPNGDLVAKDANGHVAAKYVKADKSLHVFTNHGEFIEKNDWSVSFKSSDGTKDWQSLHKGGPIPGSKLGDYGVQTTDRSVKF